MNSDPDGLLTLLGDVSKRCREKWETKTLPRLQGLVNKESCSKFFCDELKADLASLMQGVLPFLIVKEGSSGSFTADPIPSESFRRGALPDSIEIGKRTLCSSVERTVFAVVHEMGHFADFHFNEDRFKNENNGGTHYDGCQAEVACFGFAAGLNCKILGYPFKDLLFSR
jgi:hypothetical protein